jgi:hypothetical protein
MGELSGNKRNLPYLRASLGDLFRAREAEAPTCDACGVELDPSAAGDGAEGAHFAVGGKGVYFSARGEDVRFEDVPLCPSCGAAIGLSALRQWEIEEEEG